MSKYFNEVREQADQNIQAVTSSIDHLDEFVKLHPRFLDRMDKAFLVEAYLRLGDAIMMISVKTEAAE